MHVEEAGFSSIKKIKGRGEEAGRVNIERN
jgi:hypothetical protein